MESIERKLFEKSNRIVVKVGSSLIINQKNGLINKSVLNLIVSEIHNLINMSKEITLVSSGAIALGKKALRLRTNYLKTSEKQAAAAVGQVLLVNAWQEAFEKKNISCAQILLTHNDAENRRRSLNARNTIESLIKLNIIAIINENDSIATEELRYGDNDQLAARVSQIISADLLILLSDVEGLFSSNPLRNSRAKLINRVYKITRQIEKISENTGSATSVGGMHTKIKAAKLALAFGCNMIIALGNRKKCIQNTSEKGKSTWFISKTSPTSARKKWISSQLVVKGNITIDHGAEKALLKGASLLPAGIISVKGRFEKGDIINILNKNRKELFVGLTSYSSIEIKKIAGSKSNEIKNLLGYHIKDVVVHRDDMVIKKK